MHILITNDDGIRAEGLLQLTRAAIRAGHRVTVCAPDRERSASSHSLSIVPALRVVETAVEGAPGWAVDGTPVDCARLGVFLTRGNPADLVISGINRGPNLGGACIYSGTVNAAMEASMAGRPALAASLNSFSSRDYSAAAEMTLRVAEWAVRHPLPRGVMYNLNVPDLPAEKIRGIRATQTLAPEYLSEARYEDFVSEYGHHYYFLTDGENHMPYPDDSDWTLVRDGWATVSALTWDIAYKGRVDPADETLNGNA